MKMQTILILTRNKYIKEILHLIHDRKILNVIWNYIDTM